jgi:hypothetical protein
VSELPLRVRRRHLFDWGTEGAHRARPARHRCYARLVVWFNEGLSHRAIREKLSQAGIEASHTAVGRRLRSIRQGSSPLRQLEVEVWRNLELNVSDFDEAEMRVREIEETAFDGDAAKGWKPDLKLAQRTVVRRIELMLNKHRFFQGAVDMGPAVTKAETGPLVRRFTKPLSRRRSRPA